MAPVTPVVVDGGVDSKTHSYHLSVGGIHFPTVVWWEGLRRVYQSKGPPVHMSRHHASSRQQSFGGATPNRATG